MRIPKPLSKAVNEALKGGYTVQLLINGDYYDVAKGFNQHWSTGTYNKK